MAMRQEEPPVGEREADVPAAKKEYEAPRLERVETIPVMAGSWNW